MKVLIVGSGGREHAIAWKISQNPKVNKIFAAPGNAYNKVIKNCENINLKTSDDILNFALNEKIDLTIVGSEELLVDGIVDKFLFSILKSHLGKGVNRFLTAISRYRIRGDAQFCQLVFFGILYIQLH